MKSKHPPVPRRWSLGAGIATVLLASLPAAAGAQSSADFSLVDTLSVDEMPRVIKRGEPHADRYVMERLEGTVLVLVRIGKDGRPREPRVVRSIPPLDSAAVRTAAQWLFSPAIKNGRPVPLWVTIPIRFSTDTRSVSEAEARRVHEDAQKTFDDACTELRSLGPRAPSDSDVVLRERIVRAYASLEHPPVVPKTAWDRLGQALAFMTTQDRAEDALDALSGALFEAPWWGEPYRQIARVQESLGHRRAAATSLELYLLTAPRDPDWETLRARIRALRESKP